MKGQWMRVVGVAKLAKYTTFAEAPKPFFFVPLSQDFSIRASVNIRTSVDAGTMAAALAREIRALDANLAPSEIITMRHHVNRTALASQQIVVSLRRL